MVSTEIAQTMVFDAASGQFAQQWVEDGSTADRSYYTALRMEAEFVGC